MIKKRSQFTPKKKNCALLILFVEIGSFLFLQIVLLHVNFLLKSHGRPMNLNQGAHRISKIYDPTLMSL